MKDEEVIAALVKGRERCRQIVQLYQNLRDSLDDPKGSCQVGPSELQTANRIMTQLLDYLHSLPKKPSEQIQTASMRENAERLLRETGDLLECALVAERDLRARMASPVAPPVGAARQAALDQYGGGGGRSGSVRRDAP